MTDSHEDTIDSVIFDLGGTLIYFNGEWSEVLPLSFAALLKQLKSAGLNVDEDLFMETYQARMRETYVKRQTETTEYTTTHLLRVQLSEMGYPSVPEPTIRQAIDAMYSVTQQYWLPEPDAISTLQKLQMAGYRLGIISNAGDEADIQSLVDNANLRSYFDFVIVSAAVGYRKPSRKIFQTALDYWDTNPSHVVMIGDTLSADILGAKEAGIFAIWITRRADTIMNSEYQGSIQPDATVENLSEIPNLIVQINKKRVGHE